MVDSGKTSMYGGIWDISWLKVTGQFFDVKKSIVGSQARVRGVISGVGD